MNSIGINPIHESKDLSSATRDAADQLVDVVHRCGLQDHRDLVRALHGLQKRAAFPQQKIAILSDSAAYKTSLVSALVETPIEEVGIPHSTTASTYLIYGQEPEASVTLQDNLTARFPLDQLADFVDQKASSLSKVMVRLPSNSLKKGLLVIDTPLIEGDVEAMYERTELALRDADACVLILQPGETLSKAVEKFLEVGREVQEKFFVYVLPFKPTAEENGNDAATGLRQFPENQLDLPRRRLCLLPEMPDASEKQRWKKVCERIQGEVVPFARLNAEVSMTQEAERHARKALDLVERAARSGPTMMQQMKLRRGIRSIQDILARTRDLVEESSAALRERTEVRETPPRREHRFETVASKTASLQAAAVARVEDESLLASEPLVEKRVNTTQPAAPLTAGDAVESGSSGEALGESEVIHAFEGTGRGDRAVPDGEERKAETTAFLRSEEAAREPEVKEEAPIFVEEARAVEEPIEAAAPADVERRARVEKTERRGRWEEAEAEELLDREERFGDPAVLLLPSADPPSAFASSVREEQRLATEMRSKDESSITREERKPAAIPNFPAKSLAWPRSNGSVSGVSDSIESDAGGEESNPLAENVGWAASKALIAIPAPGIPREEVRKEETLAYAPVEPTRPSPSAAMPPRSEPAPSMPSQAAAFTHTAASSQTSGVFRRESFTALMQPTAKAPEVPSNGQGTLRPPMKTEGPSPMAAKIEEVPRNGQMLDVDEARENDEAVRIVSPVSLADPTAAQTGKWQDAVEAESGSDAVSGLGQLRFLQAAGQEGGTSGRFLVRAVAALVVLACVMGLVVMLRPQWVSSIESRFSTGQTAAPATTERQDPAMLPSDADPNQTSLPRASSGAKREGVAAPLEGRSDPTGARNEGAVGSMSATGSAEDYGGDSALQRTLARWASTYRSGNIQANMASYAPFVDTYFNMHNVRPEQILYEKQQAGKKTAHYERFSIAPLSITDQGNGQKTVTIKKDWLSANTDGTHSVGSDIEKMVLVKIDGDWKIVGEQEVRLLKLHHQ